MCVHGSNEGIDLISMDESEWDQCTCGEWTIARAASKLMVGKFRYCGDRKWEYFDPGREEWMIDRSSQKIKKFVRLHICERLRSRATWWHNQGTDFDSQHRSMKLLEAAQKIHTDSFMRKLLKELQCFLTVA